MVPSGLCVCDSLSIYPCGRRQTGLAETGLETRKSCIPVGSQTTGSALSHCPLHNGRTIFNPIFRLERDSHAAVFHQFIYPFSFVQLFMLKPLR